MGRLYNLQIFRISGIAKHIAASGFGVYAVDHPGFGLSEGLHGYIPSFDHIVDNVIEQYAKIKGASHKALSLSVIAHGETICNRIYFLS